MSDLVVFIVIVAAMAGVGIVLGMIVAGRLDRLLTRGSPEPPMTPPDPPTAPQAPQEEQS